MRVTTTRAVLLWGLIGLTAAASAAPAQAPVAPAAGKRPNILMIMADDVGYWNVGAYSHGMMVPTPNIDRLAKEGILFTDHYAKHSTGEIRLTADRSGGWCEIRVQDFGEGIPPEKLEHVFDRFYRSEDAATIPGFGLGLPIAKALTVGQGGEIIMESEPGRGSTVILSPDNGGNSFHQLEIYS